jgi:uncharacterized protein YndB with AHSA1/START domain
MKKILIVVGLLILLVVAGFGILIATATNVRQLREASSLNPNGKAERTRTKDALDYSVAVSIAAPPAAVWALLTDAPGYTGWNSTIVKLDGPIAMGSTLQLVSTDAPKRTFPLKVSAFEPPRRMVWEDGGKSFMGVRTFTLTPSATGTTFAMSETLSGAMLGMIEGSLPDFTGSFEKFAADLKKAAESKGQAQTH